MKGTRLNSLTAKSQQSAFLVSAPYNTKLTTRCHPPSAIYTSIEDMKKDDWLELAARIVPNSAASGDSTSKASNRNAVLIAVADYTFNKIHNTGK